MSKNISRDKKLIAGNWKMHNSIKETSQLLDDLTKEYESIHSEHVEMVVCPTFTSLETANGKLNAQKSGIKLGAQNVSWENSGAFTGEISPQMLKEHGVEYVIIGHSERRAMFGDNNETVNKRLKNTLKNNLKPIVCVGETLSERENCQTDKVIKQQVCESLKNMNSFVANNNSDSQLTVAYEPVWAIGTGKTATSLEANDVCKLIRTTLSGMFGEEFGEHTRILYGGSVNAKNASDLFSQTDIDGALVGGAALKALDFIDIYKAAIVNTNCR